MKIQGMKMPSISSPLSFLFKTMPTYQITYQVNRFLDYKVEADSEKDATKAINDGLVDHYDDYTDYDTSVIHSIEKEED